MPAVGPSAPGHDRDRGEMSRETSQSWSSHAGAKRHRWQRPPYYPAPVLPLPASARSSIEWLSRPNDAKCPARRSSRWVAESLWPKRMQETVLRSPAASPGGLLNSRPELTRGSRR